MAAVKNEKNIVSQKWLYLFWWNLFCWCTLTLSALQENKFWNARQQMAAISKIEKSQCLCNGLTDFGKIWHDYASRLSRPRQPICIRIGLNACFSCQVSAQITSSLDWRICHLQSQHPPCGTTMSVLSIQVLWVKEPLLIWRARHACCLTDISSCKLKALLFLWTSLRSKCTFQVC